MAPQTHEIAGGVYWLPLRAANAYFVRSDDGWALIDAGFPGSEGTIEQAAARLCGPGERPQTILLTHGHPDHAGAAVSLAERWRAPVMIPEAELPFVDGTALYPEPFVAFLERVLPDRAIQALVRRSDLGGSVRPFRPAEGVPGLTDWCAVPTPGHTPGHVAYHRAGDRTLVTGDAVLTLAWWSRLGDRGVGWLWDLARCRPRLTGPPTIVTCDWGEAAASTVALSELDPWALAAGHGLPLAGRHVAPALRDFAARLTASPAD